MFQSTISKAALLLLGASLFAGCATTTAQSRWLSVTDQNTRESYEKFAEAYPDSEEAREARKRAEDPDYAFLATCRLWTQKAFEGFLISYPASDYASTAHAYVEFLKETRRGDLNSYKRFITQHPDHPFAPLAKVSVPLIWLKETGRKTGLVVKVEGLINKGLLGGGYGDAQKIRQRVSETLKKELDKEGIGVVLLDDPTSDRVIEEGIGAIIVANYSESPPPPTSPPIVAGPYNSPLANALHWSSVETLSNLISVTPVQVLLISVKGADGGVEYFSDFRTLSTPTGRVNRVEALKTIGNYSGPAGAMVALQQPSLKPEERKTDEELLSQLKHADGVSVARRPDNPVAVDRETAIQAALEGASSREGM